MCDVGPPTYSALMIHFHDPKPPSLRGGEPVAPRRAGIAPWGDPWAYAPDRWQGESGFPALATAHVLLRISHERDGATESTTIALEPDLAVAARTTWLAEEDAPLTRLEEAGPGDMLPLILDSFPDDTMFRSEPCAPETPPVAHRLSGSLRDIVFDEDLPDPERAARMRDEGVAPEVIDAVCSRGVTVVVALELREDPTQDAPDEQWISMWTRGDAGLYAIGFEPADELPDAGPEEATGASDAETALQTVVRSVPAGDVAQQIMTRVALALDHVAEIEAHSALRRAWTAAPDPGSLDT